jgi:hypothetical protein
LLASLRTFFQKKTEKKTEKKRKRKPILRVAMAGLSRFLQQKIQPDRVEIFFAKPVGLDLYCPMRGLVRSHPIFAFLFIFLN